MGPRLPHPLPAELAAVARAAKAERRSRTALRARTRAALLKAREQGWTWNEIGAAARISGMSASLWAQEPRPSMAHRKYPDPAPD